MMLRVILYSNFSRATGKRNGSSSVILYTTEMFEPVENILFAYADDSTLLAVVRKPTYRPAVAAFLNRDLARIQEWCNHWCMILNPSKTKALVVSRSRTVNPPHGDLVLSLVSIRDSPNIDILCVKFDSKFTFEDHVRGIVSRVSQTIGILRLVKRIFVDTSAFVVILHLFSQSLSICSPVWGSAAVCHLQLLKRQGCIRWPGFVPIRVSCCVIDGMWLGLVCCTRLIRTLITVCAVSLHLLLLEFGIPELRPQLIHWSLKYQCVERPNLLDLSCRLRFECGMTFPTLCLTPERWMSSGAVNRWLLP